MSKTTLNPGKYKHLIKIVEEETVKDKDGFKIKVSQKEILNCYAEVKTTRGFTLIVNDSDFEKAYTNFTIRFPKLTVITRDMFVVFNNKKYSIEYLNNINEANIELEIQSKLVNR